MRVTVQRARESRRQIGGRESKTKRICQTQERARQAQERLSGKAN